MFRPLLRSLLLGATLGGACHAEAQAQAQERRQALVIGNADYRSLGRLATPTADARLVADTLRRSGFEVTEQENVDDRSMRRVLREFTQRVDAGGPGGVAVVYLAGYALYSETANFFLPVNAQLRRPEDGGLQGMSVDDVLAAVSSTAAQLRVVLVDAARIPASLDRQQFGAGGFAAVLVPEQTIVGLSAQPGALAPEGDRNSPFAAALSRYLGAPGLHIEESLRQVRCEVYETTKGQQIPWESSTFIGTFVALPGQARGPDVCAPAPVQAGRASAGSTRAFAALPAAIPIPRDRPRGSVRVTRERLVQLPPEQAYEEVIEDGSVGAYETFVEVYPNDPRTIYFRDRVRARQESDVWLDVVEENSPQAYERYLQRFPYGSYRNQAVVRIERFGGRVPVLPPPPREYYEEVLRPRATIVGPGIMAPPRQVFVPGAQNFANPGPSAPAAAQPPAALSRPAPAGTGASISGQGQAAPVQPAPSSSGVVPQPAPSAAPRPAPPAPVSISGQGQAPPAQATPSSSGVAPQPAPVAAPRSAPSAASSTSGQGQAAPVQPAPSSSGVAPHTPPPAASRAAHPAATAGQVKAQVPLQPQPSPPQAAGPVPARPAPPLSVTAPPGPVHPPVAPVAPASQPAAASRAVQPAPAPVAPKPAPAPQTPAPAAAPTAPHAGPPAASSSAGAPSHARDQGLRMEAPGRRSPARPDRAFPSPERPRSG